MTDDDDGEEEEEDLPCPCRVGWDAYMMLWTCVMFLTVSHSSSPLCAISSRQQEPPRARAVSFGKNARPTGLFLFFVRQQQSQQSPASLSISHEKIERQQQPRSSHMHQRKKNEKINKGAGGRHVALERWRCLVKRQLKICSSSFTISTLSCFTSRAPFPARKSNACEFPPYKPERYNN